MIPFAMKFNQELAQFFYDMNISVALSTYQAGKVVFISAKSPDRLIQIPRNFDTPMGMAKDKNRFAVSTVDEVIRFTNEPQASNGYQRKNKSVDDKPYDAFFVPTTTHYTGKVHMHDIEFGKGGIYGINTNFSLLGIINGDHNFLPIWKPYFIKENTSQDQCHLNGLAMSNGEPKYVTALSATNENQGWRKDKLNGGILMDVKSNSIILDKLQMPHSPRIYKDKLYLLQSSSGTISQIDMKTYQIEKTKELKGFVRGMDIYNDYAFIGLSKIRETSQAFGDMPIASYKNRAGFILLHLPTFSIVGEVIYESSVDEIFDVKVIENCSKPNILNTTENIHKELIIYPNTAFWSQELKKTDTKIEPRKFFDKKEFFKKDTKELNYTIYDIYKIRDYDHFIIDFWLKNNILDQKEAFRRVSEVAAIVVDAKDNIVGLRTIYQDIFEDEQCYIFRGVVLPNAPSAFVWKELIIFTLNTFQTRYEMDKQTNLDTPKVAVMEMENTKFNKRGIIQVLEKIGWQKMDNNEKNQTVYIYRFDKNTKARSK